MRVFKEIATLLRDGMTEGYAPDVDRGTRLLDAAIAVLEPSHPRYWDMMNADVLLTAGASWDVLAAECFYEEQGQEPPKKPTPVWTLMEVDGGTVICDGHRDRAWLIGQSGSITAVGWDSRNFVAHADGTRVRKDGRLVLWIRLWDGDAIDPDGMPADWMEAFGHILSTMSV